MATQYEEIRADLAAHIAEHAKRFCPIDAVCDVQPALDTFVHDRLAGDARPSINANRSHQLGLVYRFFSCEDMTGGEERLARRVLETLLQEVLRRYENRTRPRQRVLPDTRMREHQYHRAYILNPNTGERETIAEAKHRILHAPTPIHLLPKRQGQRKERAVYQEPGPIASPISEARERIDLLHKMGVDRDQFHRYYAVPLRTLRQLVEKAEGESPGDEQEAPPATELLEKRESTERWSDGVPVPQCEPVWDPQDPPDPEDWTDRPQVGFGLASEDLGEPPEWINAPDHESQQQEEPGDSDEEVPF